MSYAKAPFAGPEKMLSYLGRYTHRDALSNHRLLDVTAERVTLRRRGEETVTLSPVELLRRFLLHVLPPGFVKIRHDGLLAATNLATRLVTAQRLLGQRSSTEGSTSTAPEDWRTLLTRLTGIDLTRCPVCCSPVCGSQLPVREPFPSSLPPRASPPGALP